jgi:glycogen operon protein
MAEQDWSSGFGRAVAVFLNGDAITGLDPRGERVRDDSFMLCFSAHHEPIDFQLPTAEYGESWRIVLDTATSEVSGDDERNAGSAVTVGPRALVVLQRVA